MPSESVLVVAGETSGEHHAAGLIAQIRLQNPGLELQWFGSGGPAMAEAGVELLGHVSDLSAIGPRAALGQMRHYWKLYRRILDRCGKQRTRLAVLVDFPEFNLLLARRLRQMRIPVCYFIGPQVWAWRPGRIDRIRECVDLMLVILPFEEEYYRSRGVEAHYVGNPTKGFLGSVVRQREVPKAGEVPVVALLPGSRRREVELIFPALLEAAVRVSREIPVRFVVSRAPEIRREQLASIQRRWMDGKAPSLDLEIVEKEPGWQVLSRATCAVVKSGTSTLEATVLGIPFAMVYRISWASWLFARPLVSTDTYCLANLVAGRRIVQEFVQREATGEKIASYLLETLKDAGRRCEIARDLDKASEKLGNWDAYQQGAAHVSRLLSD